MSTIPNFRMMVIDDQGEVENTTLIDFLADNEGSETICHLVKELQPGQERTANGYRYIRAAATVRSGKTRVQIPDTIDGVKGATVIIDRRRLLFAVRLKRRHKLYELPLGEVAKIVFDRVVRADTGVGRRLRPRRRSR